jgi:hypothetical protein
MIGALRSRDSVRQAVGLAAALFLAIQVLAVGNEVAPVAPRSATPAAGHHHDPSGHHAPSAPATPQETAHCSWCILCGKLGAAVGTPPVPTAIVLPAAISIERIVGRSRAGAESLFRPVLPVGARAPPWFL